MKIQELRDALLSITEQTYHYIAPQQQATPYIVWGETGAASALDADDGTEIVRVHGEIWYYTSDEYDKTVDKICEALQRVEIGWGINSIGRDTKTGDIVYGFSWEALCGYGEIY